MALVDYVDPETADERTRTLLEADADYYGQPSLFARAMANNPDVFAVHREYHRRLVVEGAVDERLAELVYLAVPVTNDCPYCVASHREQLVERVGLPESDAEALARGDHAPFDDRERAARVKRAPRSCERGGTTRERAAVEFAEQVTLDPKTVDEAHLAALGEAGFDDAAVVHLLTVAAAAVAANAIADALSIHPADREEPFR